MQGQKPIKQEIQQPGNLPVGFLRRTVAEWLGKQPQYVRLVAGVSAAGCSTVWGCCGCLGAAVWSVCCG